MIGRQLSHYRIVEKLGEGGMGRVYRAEDTLLGRPVALKFPHGPLVHDPSTRARFLREARAASALDHPNIVVLYDVCDVEGEVFIAMQYVDGPSLRERLRGGAPPLPETVAIGRAVADALAHAHARGVVHRDIKPENILLCPDGRPKVADFGLALLNEDHRLTTLGTIVGTPAYVAPEILAGAKADARSDLFSLGATLYELSSGTPPFTGDRVDVVLYRLANEDPAPLPITVPEALDRLIGALLAKAPAHRLATAEQVSDSLARMAGASPVAARSTEGPPARSVAVLPFRNLTGNAEDDYFCAGVTEDLLTDLLKIPDLQVASRGAVAALEPDARDPRQAGRRLAVAALVEGSMRRAGGRVRVTAQLVRADSGYQIWADRYDRTIEDLFEVQEDIARSIAAALRLALGPDDAESRLGRRTRNARAYDLRLQALDRYRRFEEADMRAAIALLEQAVAADPDYALARADLAECLVQMTCKGWDRTPAWLERAEREARRSLELAPSLPEGFRARGHVWNHRRDMRRGLEDFVRAVELDPRYSGALVGLAVNHMYLGDLTGAEVYCRRSIAADPLDGRAAANLALILFRQRRFPELEELCERQLAGNPSPHLALVTLEALLLARLGQGDTSGAAAILDRIPEGLRERPMVAAMRAATAASAGRTAEAAALLAGLEPVPRDDATLAVAMGRVHAMIGQRGRAIACLARAGALDVLDASEFRADPYLRELAGDPLIAPLLAAPI